MFVLLAAATIWSCNETSIFRPITLALSEPNPNRPYVLTLEINNTGPPVISDAICRFIRCPIATGYNDLSTSTIWPADRNGIFHGHIEWRADTGAQLLCLETSTQYGESRLSYFTKMVTLR
jgi:hypothetical protein